MTRRAFPFALGIGTDICSLTRINRIITNPKGSTNHFISRVLNPTERLRHESWLEMAKELDTLKVALDELPTDERALFDAKAWNLASFLGGRWAAKEAARKAHTWRELKLHDITILGNQHRGTGASVAPTMTVRTKDRTGLQVVKFSISHDGGYATAVCLAAEDTEDSEPRLEIDKEDDIVHKT